MDYPSRRNYHQYNHNNQSDSRSRVLDHRVKQPYHHQEHTFYDNSSGRSSEARGNMADMYDEKPTRSLEERVTENRPLEISGPRKKEYNEEGDVNVNGRHMNGGRKRPISSKDDFIPVTNSMVTMSDESTLPTDAPNAQLSSKSGGPLVAQSAGTVATKPEKEIFNDGSNPINTKEPSATIVASKDPEELRQKVLESLAEKKKKAQVFMIQEKEGAKKELPPETQGISGTSTLGDADSGNLERGQKSTSIPISNPEREAAVDALLAEMGSAKSSKPEKGQVDVNSGSSKQTSKASAEELTEQKTTIDTGKPTQNDYQKIVPTSLEFHEPESLRRSSFAGHHTSAIRNDKQPRPKKSPDSGPRREDNGSYKDGQSQSLRLRMSPLPPTRPELSRGSQRGAFEYDDRDRREDPRHDARHRLERYEDARDSRQLMGVLSPTLRGGRRSAADQRPLYSDEDKLRHRDEGLYRYVGKEEDPRDPYPPPMRHPRRMIDPELEYASSSPNFPSYIPGRYLPLREDPRLPPLARPPEADYATLYYSDLPEWLEITGYHDFSYRQMSLRRHRELRALEGNRRLPVEEADQDVARGYLARSQTIAPREELDAVSRDGRRARASSVYAMPPPPAISSREDRDTTGRVIPEGIPLRGPSRAGFYPPTSRPEERPRYNSDFRGSPPPPIETSGQKRRISHRGEDNEDSLRPAVKSARITYEGSHRASISHSDEYPDPESANAHHKEFPAHRSGHPDPADNRQNSRRLQEDERFDDVDDDTASVRQTLSKRLAAGRGRDLSPVNSEARLRKRSMSPSTRHGLDHESRKDNFKRERDIGTPSKFRREDDQLSSAGRQQRKIIDKVRRTPDASPRQEKDYHKQSRLNSGKSGMKDDRKPFPTRRGSSDDYRSQNSLSNRLSFEDLKRKPGYGRGRGRGYSNHSARHDRHEKRLSYGEPMDMDRRLEGLNDLDTRNADTRYFVVKSFNHDNVKMAQQDELWATQKKNSEIFEDAFKTSRDVILVFSVNKSGKFQGYARMESAPGSAPVPSWAKNLLWESSGPFRIRWITICDVNFHRVAHLINRLNENQPVLIGRDGQEIDPECGAALCKLIDDSAASFRRRPDGDGA